MKLRISVITLLLMVFLTACSAPPELRNEKFLNDDSLISGEPCAAPCWRGITPGETTWDAAITLLEDDTTISNLKEESNDESKERVATFQPIDGVLCCLVYSQAGETVDQILLQLAPNLTLEDILEKYGEPQYITPLEIDGDANQGSVTFYYPESKLLVYVFAAGKEKGELTEASEVFAVLYMRDSDMQEVMKSSALYAWTGYATFKEYLDATPEVTPEPVSTEEASN